MVLGSIYGELGREPLMEGVYDWLRDLWEPGNSHAITIHPNHHRAQWTYHQEDFTQREMTLEKKVSSCLQRAERAMKKQPGSRGFRLVGVLAKADTDHLHIHGVLRVPRWATKKSRLVWGRAIHKSLTKSFPAASIDLTKLRRPDDFESWCGYMVSQHQGYAAPFITTKED